MFNLSEITEKRHKMSLKESLQIWNSGEMPRISSMIDTAMTFADVMTGLKF